MSFDSRVKVVEEELGTAGRGEALWQESELKKGHEILNNQRELYAGLGYLRVMDGGQINLRRYAAFLSHAGVSHISLE